MDEIKGALREPGKVANVALHGPDGMPVMPCGLAVPLELALAEVEHRHSGTQQRERGGLLPATAGQAEYLQIGDILAEWVHHDRNHVRQMMANVQAYVWPHMGNAQRFSQP